VTTAEQLSMSELIDDCARLPEAVQHPAPPPQRPHKAPPWQVDDKCVSQVAELDDYGC
jgi:hypothetical protein